jgi:hypothetical protein
VNVNANTGKQCFLGQDFVIRADHLMQSRVEHLALSQEPRRSSPTLQCGGGGICNEYFPEKLL